MHLAEIKVACARCSLADLCLPAAATGEELSRIETRVRRNRLLEKGRSLFLAGQPTGSLYVVRHGGLKSVITSEQGEEQIVGLHLPGEIVGMDALAGQAYRVSAVALENSSLCEIPLEELEGVLEEVPRLSRQMLRMVSREVSGEQRHHELLARRSAVERVALFLLRYSERLELRSLRSDEFALNISRQDLANFLGLKIETVSRAFSTLRDAEVIEVDRRSVSIIDREGLRSQAGHGQSEKCAS